MLSVKTILTNILDWIIGTRRYYSASWTASSSSASGTKLTGDMALPKGTYQIAVSTPNCQGSTGICCLRVGTAVDATTMITLPNGYTKASFILQLSSQQTIYLLTQSTASVTFGNTERGGMKAVRLCG